jgi:hypothetical protein
VWCTPVWDKNVDIGLVESPFQHTCLKHLKDCVVNGDEYLTKYSVSKCFYARITKLGAESQNIQGMNILLAERLVSENYEARSGKSKYSRYEYFVSGKPLKKLESR